MKEKISFGLFFLLILSVLVFAIYEINLGFTDSTIYDDKEMFFLYIFIGLFFLWLFVTEDILDFKIKFKKDTSSVSTLDEHLTKPTTEENNEKLKVILQKDLRIIENNRNISKKIKPIDPLHNKDNEES